MIDTDIKEAQNAALESVTNLLADVRDTFRKLSNSNAGTVEDWLAIRDNADAAASSLALQVVALGE